MNLNPLAWFRKGAPSPPPLGGTLAPYVDWPGHRRQWTEKELLGYYRDTAFYCANLNARGVARTPLLMYRKGGTGERRPINGKRCDRMTIARLKLAGYVKDDAVTEILDHPFLDLLDRPYYADGVPQMGRFTFLEITQLYLEIVGRAYWEIDDGGTKGGPPSQIFPLIADKVEPYRAPGSKRFVDKYKYHAAGMTLKEIDPGEVVPFLCPSLADPYTGGYSPMQAVADRLGLVMSYVSQNQATLNNRARPDMIVAPSAKEGAVVSQPTIDRIEDWFKAQFGKAGIGAPLVSREPLEVHPLSFTPKDMGELVAEEFAVKQIARGFDVPLSMLDKDANRASANDGRKQHAYDAICPRHRRLEHAINAHIISRYDDSGRTFVKFDEPYHEPLAPEAKDLAGLVGKVLMEDEVREMMGFGPMPEEYKAEMEARRKEEMEAKKPPERPVPTKADKAADKDYQTYLRARTAIRNGVPLNGCKSHR